MSFWHLYHNDQEPTKRGFQWVSKCALKVIFLPLVSGFWFFLCLDWSLAQARFPAARVSSSFIRYEDTGCPKSRATRSFAAIFLFLIAQVAEADFWIAKGPPILENFTAWKYLVWNWNDICFSEMFAEPYGNSLVNRIHEIWQCETGG